MARPNQLPAVAVPAEGADMGILGIGEGITGESAESSKTEELRGEPGEELRLIADALPVLIAHVDARERYRFNNRAYEKWFGISPAALAGRTIRTVVGEAGYEAVRPHIQAVIAGKKQSFETRLLHRTLGQRTVQVHYIPRVTRNRTTDGFFILMTDITEHREMEAENQTANAELEQRVRDRTSQLEAINRELEAFCYSVSHDLRAPLRTIRGFGEVLLEQYSSQLDERGRDFLRRTCLASGQMDLLIEDLLKLSRVSRGEFRVEPINLTAMAGEIIADLKKAEPGREVHFKSMPDLQTHGDERLIRLVLENLLRNAWKFTSKRAVAHIEFGRSETHERAFFVQDDGAGFDMTYVAKLFGAFQRLHSTNDFPGSGVGLAIVQRIINRHGGRAWATGEVDAGATFYFTLPAKKIC